MSPWTIIGWLLVALLAIPVIMILLALLFRLGRIIRHQFGYWKTKNDQPAEGQVWQDRGRDLVVRVTRVSSEGVVMLQSGSTSFGHNPERWKLYVKNRGLRRVV